MSDIRCVRCGRPAAETLYCEQCFSMEFTRSVMGVVAREVDDRPEWVRRAQDADPRYPQVAKELS